MAERRQLYDKSTAPLTLESVKRNLTDLRKMGTKRSVLTDKKGIFRSVVLIVLSGANIHGSNLLEDTLGNDVILCHAPEYSQQLNKGSNVIGCDVSCTLLLFDNYYSNMFYTHC